jgi:8-oxo-dGTP pyrophosphatase MutT (NUDIX family)
MRPRPAAAAVLLREGDDRTLEVLLARRTPEARFLPNAWVFPGGAVDSGSDHEDAFRLTASREVGEEVCLELPADAELVLFDRIVTPEWAPIRFDTCFFLLRTPESGVPRPDGSEIVELTWIEPAEALRHGGAGTMLVAAPTALLLSRLTEFDTVEEALDPSRGQTVVQRTLSVAPPESAHGYR